MLRILVVLTLGLASIFLRPLFLFVVAITTNLLFFLLDLISFNLTKLRNSCPSFFVGPRPRFFSFKVFYKNFLIASASFEFFCKLFITGNLLVYFLNHWREVGISFSLSLNSFLYQIFSVIQLLAIVFYLTFDQKFKFIAEKTNRVGFIWAVIIKL